MLENWFENLSHLNSNHQLIYSPNKANVSYYYLYLYQYQAIMPTIFIKAYFFGLKQ